MGGLGSGLEWGRVWVERGGWVALRCGLGAVRWGRCMCWEWGRVGWGGVGWGGVG